MVQTYKVIRLSKIFESPITLRPVDTTSEEYKGLLQSVKVRGVLQPIIVRAIDQGYRIVKGHHRYCAAIDAGLGVIPAVIIEVTDAQIAEIQIIASVHHVKTKPVEYAAQLLRLIDHHTDLKMNDLCAKLGKTPKWIRDTLRLNNLEPLSAQLANDGKMVLMNAYQLARLPHDDQKKLIDKAQTMDTHDSNNSRMQKERRGNHDGENHHARFGVIISRAKR